MHAITGQQVGPGHSYLLQQQPFGASTWRSGGTFSPNVPLRKRKPGEAVWFSFRGLVNTAGCAAERLDPKGSRYWKGSSGIAALCQRQHHLRGHRRVTRGTFSKHCKREPPPIVTGVCFETNTRYRTAFTSKGSECSEVTKCHRPDSEKRWRTSPDWEDYQQQCIQNFIAIRQV